MSEGKLQSMFDVFFESNLINFGCVEGKMVRSNEVKKEIIEADREMFQ